MTEPLDVSKLDPEITEHLQKMASPAHLAAYVTRHLPPDAQWRPFDHLLHINDKLVEAFTDEEETFLNIAVTVRHGKSFLISIFAVVWYLGMYPDRQVVIVSYSEDKVKEWGEATKNIMQEFGLELFGLQVDTANASKTSWSLKGHKGGVRAVGIGGALTGRAIDLGIIDDPVKNAEEANSEAARSAMWDWYTTTFRTRLMPGGTVVLTMARWHEDDLTGKIKENLSDESDPWQFIEMPALAEAPKPPEGVEDADEWRANWRDWMGRADGQELWPEVWPKKRLLKIMNSVGGENSATWLGLYQQNPTPPEGGMFKVANWRYIESRPANLQLARYWDLAATKGGGDWSVGVLVGLSPDGVVYVADVVRVQEDSAGLKRLVLTTAKQDGRHVPIKIEQERAGAGKSQVEDYKRMLLGWVVDGRRPEGSKESRAAPFASQQQVGNVYLVRGEWNKAYVEEHRAFPKSKHDDQCLTGDTLVSTPSGDVAISSVRRGDLVLGASGWVSVGWAGMTSPSAAVTSRGGVRGTASHPVWTGRGWVPLTDLRRDDMLMVCPARSLDVLEAPSVEDCAASTTTGGVGTGTPYSAGESTEPHPCRAQSTAANSAPRPEGCAASITPGGGGLAAHPERPRSPVRYGSSQSSSTGSSFAGIQMPPRRTTGDTTRPAEPTPHSASSHSTGRSTGTTMARSRADGTSTTSTATGTTTIQRTWKPYLEGATRPTTSLASQLRTPSVLTSMPSAIWLPNGIAQMRGWSGTGDKESDFVAREAVYNLTTSDGTFFANGILVHNCDASAGAFEMVSAAGPVSAVMEEIQELDLDRMMGLALARRA